MDDYSTEYLIMHEDTIDWDELSANKDFSLSLVEARLFRSKINWRKYLNTHRFMSTDALEIASKYFTEENYRQLAAFNIVTDNFVKSHPEKFDFTILLKSAALKESTILDLQEYWSKIPGIFKIISESIFIDLESEEFANLAVMLEALN